TTFLSRGSSRFRRLPVIPQGHVHEDISSRSIEAHHQRFSIFATFAAFLGGVQRGRTNVKVESLIVERGNGISNNLVGQLAHRLPHQFFVGFGHCNSRQTAGESERRSQVDIENDSPFDLARQVNFGSDPLPPVRLFFHAQVLDGNRRSEPLRQRGVRRVDERLNYIHSHG